MVLPHIEGRALDTILHAEPPLELGRVVDVMLQVLDALKHAHAQGVVHRDLKPANVLMRGGTHALVVDFGLAKILTGDTMATMLTAHNMVCGTPEYMAPEQARGDEIDARCDIYAAGVMPLSAPHGDPPFTGPTPLAILTEHLTSEPEPPSARAPQRGISPALEAVALHAMAKDPDTRYGAATAMSAALVHAREARRCGVGPARCLSVERRGGRGRPRAYVPGAVTDRALIAPRPSRKISPPRSYELGERGWRVIWIVAILTSVAIGVWLSLRAP